MRQEPIPVTGIWLRRMGKDVEVLAEIDNQWRIVIVELSTDNFSHIVEPSGMRTSPAIL